jgi:D-3-phosphoglycerate dehydrogenase
MRALILAPFSVHQLERLRARGDVVHESWLDTNRLQDPEQLGARIRDEGFDVLVVEADFVFREVFESAPALMLVGVCRNALNQVDIDSATERGIPVVHAPGRNTNAVAELVLATMLALTRRILPAHHLVSGGGWSDPAMGYRLFRGREIAGSAVGIVGFGRIGREVARKCLALGAAVRAFDPIVPPRDMEALGVRPAGLDEIAGASDIVSLHVPDNQATQRMVGASFLGRMNSDACIINTSAGSVIDTLALVDALQSRRIAGAAIDVFEGHPLPVTSPLMSAPNLLLTPHIGGATEETVERHSAMMVDEIERLLDGRPLRNVVNPDHESARVP